jgi:hypothetical protein
MVGNAQDVPSLITVSALLRRLRNNMSLKRDHWTNQEVIEILEGLQIPIKMDECKSWDKEQYDHAVTWNQGLSQGIHQFHDFKANPETSYSAMALDTETGQIVVISPPLPQ